MYIPPHSSLGGVPFPWVRTGTAAAVYSYTRTVLFFFVRGSREDHHHHDAHLRTCLTARTLLRLLCIYTKEKPERRKVKNTPTTCTPTAAELAPPYYGRYRALLTFLELLLWASIEATTATDRYPNGRAS